MKKYDFDDILIVPSVLSDVESRSMIAVNDENGFLRLFAAPMDTVVSKDNVEIFKDNRIYPIIPRTSKIPEHTDSNNWYAYSLEQFEKRFCNTNTILSSKKYVLIDIANGHMKRLYDIVKKAKKIHTDNLILMIGNIANPYTAVKYADLGVDFIRLGIGAGGGCLTSEQTGVGYPMASLIHETYLLLKSYPNTKLVADGGFKKYADIIKAYALGADYVMIGSIFNKALESAGDTFFANVKHDNWTEPGEQINQYDPFFKEMFKHGQKFYKKFRGMSTKEVQKSLGTTKIKTSEGITRINLVEYTLDGWVENFEHYLRSAMSYSNSFNLDEFKKAEIIQISKNSFKRYNK